jgi:hypothetical protein
MDSVRFGRALGFGVRAAAKTLVTAADAATTPNPTAATKETPAVGSATAGNAKVSGVRPEARTPQTTSQMRQAGQGLKEGGKRFGEAMGGRVVRLSGALWLELTGVFFGIFAFSAAAGSWRMHAALHETAGNHDAHVRFLISVVMAAVFGYFCVSSFVKANRMSRRH